MPEPEKLVARRLRRWFREYNDRYFGGALPLPTRVRLASLEDCYGDCDKIGGRFHLRIDRVNCSREKVRRATLLHEMAHVKLWDVHRGHGRIFDTEMQRLAVEGAMRGLW